MARKKIGGEGMRQFNLFENGNSEYLEKYQYALLLSAVGDSLGWPLEFAKAAQRTELQEFIKWNKLIGGKWWGYTDEILPGEYSDDTQLSLSVARSIDSSGRFNSEYFAYFELPLWLNYERGGGRAIKAAASNILRKKTKWFSNFYETEEVSYSQAGANGAAMRNLPIALVNVSNEKQFVVDSFKNTIITHGHSRAILGSLLIGAAQIYFIKSREVDLDKFRRFLSELLHSSLDIARRDEDIGSWLSSQKKYTDFEESYGRSIEEAEYFIQNIDNFLSKEEKEFYVFAKAFDTKYKGSGISTTMAAIYMSLKYLDNPEQAIIKAANMIGSDTDTIASFVGSILGGLYGGRIAFGKIGTLINLLQDKNYFLDVGKFLWEINFGKLNSMEQKLVEKSNAFLNILAWEIGLHEMFWEALGEGDAVVHPTLGRGVIQKKTVKGMRREDYVVKIFKIKFDMGQSAYFHSRVSKEGFVKQSIGRDIEKALG